MYVVSPRGSARTRVSTLQSSGTRSEEAAEGLVSGCAPRQEARPLLRFPTTYEVSSVSTAASLAVKERRIESKAIPAGAVFSRSHTTEPSWRTGGDVGKAGRLRRRAMGEKGRFSSSWEWRTSRLG